jgi:hypothetical protein
LRVNARPTSALSRASRVCSRSDSSARTRFSHFDADAGHEPLAVPLGGDRELHDQVMAQGIVVLDGLDGLERPLRLQDQASVVRELKGGRRREQLLVGAALPGARVLAEHLFAGGVGIDVAAGGVLEEGGAGEMVHEGREPLLRLAEPLEHVLLFRAELPLREGLADGRSEPAEAVLEQVIAGAVLHGLDGGVFADGAGDDDEGDVQAALVEQLQGGEGVELGHAVVGEDDVRGRIEPGQKLRARGATVAPDRQARPPQLMKHEVGVGFAVFEDQHLDGNAHTHFVRPLRQQIDMRRESWFAASGSWTREIQTTKVSRLRLPA